VCEAIRLLAEGLAGREVDELMADFGAVSRRLADHPQLRWLGPHKGVAHLALASITNACFDLWAKSRGVPLWRLLLDLTPEQVVSLLDLHYLEDILTPEKAVGLLRANAPGRVDREYVLRTGYPGYDTSVGWFSYEDEEVRERTREAMGRGFQAFKLKVGSPDADRDVRRATLLRELAGPEATLMMDANQQWTLPQALHMCEALAPMEPYWIEEPSHPDDIEAHRKLARAIAPARIALGEQVPNRVVFKNFMEAAGCILCSRTARVLRA
jgi:L-fuconate dehydratase